jgi:hypothetical protein
MTMSVIARTKRVSQIFGFALLAAAAPAMAQETAAADARVPVIQQLFDCRAITDPTARLACFDLQVAAVEAAETARDIRIVDREAVAETRRGLFGFSFGRLNIFGDGDEGVDEANNPETVQEIETTIRQFARNDIGKLVFVLENGQRWAQTDTNTGGRTPRVGQSITIRRAALGSFMASVEGRPGIRVRREQ